MWTMKLICVIMLLLSLSCSQGEKKGHSLCDVTQWHAQFVEHINNNHIDLSGWQSSTLRKIRYLIEDYGDTKVMKPCTLLIKIRSYILEESDEEEPDLNEIDVKNYKPNEVTFDSSGSDMESILIENSDRQNRHTASGEDVSSTSEGHLGQPDTIGGNRNDNAEAPNEEMYFLGQQNEDDEYLYNMEIDPTDLSFLDSDDEDGGDMENVDARHDVSDSDSLAVSNYMSLDDHLEYFDHEKDKPINEEEFENGDRNNIKQHENEEKQHSVRGDSLENGVDDKIIEKRDRKLPKHEDIYPDENGGISETQHNKSEQDTKANEETYVRHDISISNEIGTAHDESGTSCHKCKYLSFFNLQYSRLTKPTVESKSEKQNMILLKMQRELNSDLGKDIDEGNQKERRDITEEAESDSKYNESNNHEYSKSQTLKMELNEMPKGDEVRGHSENSEAQRLENVQEDNENLGDNVQEGYEHLGENEQEDNENLGDNEQEDYENIGDNKQEDNENIADNEQEDDENIGDDKQEGNENVGDNNQGDNENIADNEQEDNENIGDNKQEDNEKVADNEQEDNENIGDNRQEDYENVGDNKQDNENIADNDHENLGEKEAGDRQRAKDNSENSSDNDQKTVFNRNEIQIPDISSLLEQQEKQTSHKIDKLELTLVKLENKFLMQSLNAKDTVVSTQHIENHILKLENTLYQLNQSYNYLQRDHNALKRKQKKQNANVLRYHDKLKSCPTTQPKSENNFQLISQQKSRIWELSQVVANQSLNIHQIQSRSSYLEEQNRHLFKIVMDQSALISNILSQIQELSQNSARTKLETGELKLQFDNAFATQNRRQKSDDVSGDYSRSDNENMDEADHDQRETLLDSAFMPLETPEQTNNNEVSFEKLDEKNKLQKTNENQHANSDPSGMPLVDDDIKDNTGSSYASKIASQSGNIEVIAEHEEVLDTRNPDRASANTKEYGALENVPLGSNEDNAASNSANTEKRQQNTQKKDLQPHNILYEPLLQDRSSDCFDLYKTKGIERGVDKVFVNGLGLSVNVHCDAFGGSGGWTVLLRRDGGREDFYKNFDQYKEGFGSIADIDFFISKDILKVYGILSSSAPRSEHYLGNEVIHYLTNQKHYSLRVDLTDWEGKTRQAIYDQFWVDSEDDHFKLHVHGYSGTAGDGLAKHNGMKFSTFDVDNDLLKKELGGSCAKRFRGAGWYYKCYQSNLMGVFYKDGIIPEKRHDGITWKPWKGPNYSMKSVTMSIHPRDVE